MIQKENKKTKYLEILKAVPIFSGVDDRVLYDALSHGSLIACKSGEELDTERRLAYVVRGGVRAYSSDGGRGMLLRRIGAGEVFGVAGLFSDSTPVSRAVASGSTEILAFDADTVKSILEKDSRFMYNYIGFLSGRICYLNRKITYLSAGSAERRISLYLDSFESNTVTPDVSYSALADMLDIGRASLYRALDKMEADGRIIRNGNEITVLKTEREGKSK